MTKNRLVDLINGIISNKIKTVVIHYRRKDWTPTQFLNNKTGVTANIFVVDNSPKYIDPLSIKFGDDFIIPESLEHVVSLLWTERMFKANNIILSKTDNMNVQKIIDQMDNIISNVHPHEEMVAAFYSDGRKEVYRGIFTTSDSY